MISQVLVAEMSGVTLWRWLTTMLSAHGNIEAGSSPVIPTLRLTPVPSSTSTSAFGKAPLGADDFVISTDEKSIQARRRKQPTSPPGPNRPIRVEHEHFREGVWTYLAAWDVHRAKLFGRCEVKNGMAPEAGPFRYVILDRDSNFNDDVITFLQATVLQPKRTSVQAPGKIESQSAGSDATARDP